MRFKIVALYDEHHKKIGDITTSVARTYAKLHGYGVSVYNDLLHPELPASFSVLAAIRREMQLHPDVEWFLRLDADSIIVNPDYKLETLADNTRADFLASKDWNGLCAGVCLVRNCPWSITFLETLTFLGEMKSEHFPAFDRKNTWEQSTIKCLQRYFSSVSSRIEMIPEDIVQNPRTPFSQHAFIMHYWSKGGLDLIADKMNEYIAHGWSPAAFRAW